MITSVPSVQIRNTKFYSPNFTGRYKLFKSSVSCDSFSYKNRLQFVRKAFNYALEQNNVVTPVYKGPMNFDAGFSTEAPEIGGGWLKASTDTPLSTTGVRTCALLNLVNEEEGSQVLYHVFHSTNAGRIEEFIRNIFPNFTRVNIVGGDQFKTVNTVRKIISAVDNVDAYAPKIYYETICENPQLVAYKNNIFYIKGKSGKLSFIPNKNNYWY